MATYCTVFDFRPQECPSLTKLTNDTDIITAELARELMVSTWARGPGSVVRVWCLQGLELRGPSNVTCYDIGLWSGTPYCEGKTCKLEVMFAK